MRITPALCLISAGLTSSLARPVGSPQQPHLGNSLLVRRQMPAVLRNSMGHIEALDFGKGTHHHGESLTAEHETPLTPLLRHGRDPRTAPLLDLHFEEPPARLLHGHQTVYDTHAPTPAPTPKPHSEHTIANHFERDDPHLQRHLRDEGLAHEGEAVRPRRPTVSVEQYQADIKAAKKRRNIILGMSAVTSAGLAGFGGWAFHLSRQPAYAQGYASVAGHEPRSGQGQKIQQDQQGGDGGQQGGDGGQGGSAGQGGGGGAAKDIHNIHSEESDHGGGQAHGGSSGNQGK